MEQQTTTPSETEKQSRARIWFAIFVGPLTWSADFLLSFALTAYACGAQSTGLLLVSSVLAGGATFTGLLVAVRKTRELPPNRDFAAIRADPTRFMGIAGIVVSGGFLLAIVAGAIPRFVIDPCI